MTRKPIKCHHCKQTIPLKKGRIGFRLQKTGKKWKQIWLCWHKDENGKEKECKKYLEHYKLTLNRNEKLKQAKKELKQLKKEFQKEQEKWENMKWPMEKEYTQKQVKWYKELTQKTDQIIKNINTITSEEE